MHDFPNEGCQPHLFQHILEAVKQWGWLVPPWVDAIRVTFSPDDSGTISAMVTEEYRTVHLRVQNGWTKVREDERGRWVMHELLHIHTNHLLDTFHDLLAATTEPETPLHLWATEQARRAVERGTNDLERVLWEKLAGNPLPKHC